MSSFQGKYVRDYFLQTRIKKIVIWIISLVLVVALSFGFAFYLCQSVVIQDNSMETTMPTGERVLINSLVYSFRDPKRGEIIAFRTAKDEKSAIHIKRIIGLPGETVEIREGQIYIDGILYVEDKDFPAIINGGLAENGVELGKNEYFVMGDNRNSSEDSRYATVGNISRENIVGKLWFVLSPRNKFGFMKE